jgi:hypothetical protein
MTAENIRVLMKRNPFVPFTIKMNDGQRFAVEYPDFVFLPPGWETTAIVAQPKGVFDFIYIRNITSIESEGDIPNMPTRRRGGGPDQE